MTKRYKAPNHLFSELVKVACNRPDPLYMDAMGHNPMEKQLAWMANLELVVDQITAEAWAAGATWGLERNAKPIKAIVTPEQYERIVQGIDDYVKEEVDGQQAQDSRDGG